MLDILIGRGQNGAEGRDKVGLGSIRRPVIGLALGGGAARGFAHIGIVRTLIAHGIVPNVVVGTSIGAVVGGAYAAGHLDTLEEWARSLQPRNILGYLDIRLNGSGLIGGDKLAAQLEAAIGPDPDRGPAAEICHRGDRSAHRPRDLADPWPHGRRDARLLCAARDILAGAGRRPLAGRWRAGQSGAGLGGARVWRGDRDRRQPFQRRLHPFHHDLFARRGGGSAGAAIEPAPPKRGFGRLFSAERTMKREFFGGGGRPGISSVMVDAFNIMQDRITRARLAGDPPDMLISPRVGQIGWFDFHRADDLIALRRARRRARHRIPFRKRSTSWRRRSTVT